jgi:hypothetical protein
MSALRKYDSSRTQPVYSCVKIYSFGCSFTFGTELSDTDQDPKQRWPRPSQLTWPALVAARLGAPYVCAALGGAGNLCIMDRVLRCQDLQPVAANFGGMQPEQSLLIINWTMIDRFDYSNPEGPHYNNGGLDYLTLHPSDDTDVSNFYFRHIHSEYRDKFTNLMYIKTTIDRLRQNGIKFFMTCLDPLLFCQRWHAPPHVQDLQREIRPWVHEFEGQTFLDWSKQRGFALGPGGHPTDQAHAAALDLVFPAIESILHRA